MQYRDAIRTTAVAEPTDEAVTIVALAGRLDAAGAVEAERRLMVLAGARRVIADLAGITAADAAGVRALLRVAKRVEAEGGRLALAGLAGAVAALFEESGFAAVIAIQPAPGDACAA
ncbi:STAS domain-containing protein [Elioraea sp.]|uniref:STAS domain-containing protein n=1 Tax=Elioraea sp. TaxID=2185103 RepID=UPI003F6F2A86